MIKKYELLTRIYELESGLMQLEYRIEKLEKPKKTRKAKNEAQK